MKKGFRILDLGFRTKTDKKLFFLAFLYPISYILNPCFASNGTTSAQFLSLGAGARSVAMGELGAAVIADPNAAYWNPAGLAQMRDPEISLMHNNHFEDITHQYAAYAQPFGWGTPALSLTRLAVAPFDSYNASGQKIGTVKSQDWSLGASVGRALNSNISLGLGAKWIQETLGPATAKTAAGDFGILWKPSASLFQGAQKVTAGLSYSNLGPGLKFDTERFDLPQTLRLGLSFNEEFKRRPVILALEGAVPKNEDARVSVGAEAGLTEMIFLRAGYRFSQDIGSGLRLGFGFHMGGLTLDYAWTGFGDLGASHRVGLKLNFAGWPILPPVTQNLLDQEVPLLAQTEPPAQAPDLGKESIPEPDLVMVQNAKTATNEDSKKLEVRSSKLEAKKTILDPTSSPPEEAAAHLDPPTPKTDSSRASWLWIALAILTAVTGAAFKLRPAKKRYPKILSEKPPELAKFAKQQEDKLVDQMNSQITPAKADDPEIKEKT
ncbi:MAG: PorV/PorQ family protein [Elusimicrobia bacterium]|nr:PorV/PorQ family protein [Elusimicrobiota bacterium]